MSQLNETASILPLSGESRTSTFGELDVSVTVRRGIANIFDLSILAVVFVLFLRAYGLTLHRAVVTIPFAKWSRVLPHRVSVPWVSGHIGPLLIFGAVCLAYFAVFESALGWTPGKLLMGVRVVDFFGGRPTLTQALVRNAFRILDAYPYIIPNLVGLAIIVANRRRQRGGDKAAGTLVVDSRSSAADRQIKKWQGQRPSAEAPLADEVWS